MDVTTNDLAHLAEFMAMLKSLNHESDRGAVLISTSMLDNHLKKIILGFLVQHPETNKLVEGFNAPLGTFSARSLTALAMGLISTREYEELKTLRKIRNRFAHEVHVSFDDQQISDLCRNLTYKIPPDENDTAKRQFTTSAVGLILHLTNRAHYVSRKRLAAQDWPY